MANITLFAQVIGLLPKENIKSIIRKSGTDKHCKDYNTWSQLISMIFCRFPEDKRQNPNQFQSIRIKKMFNFANDSKMVNLADDMNNYSIIYNKLLNLPDDVEIRQAGKNPDGSKQYVSRPNGRNKTIQNIFGVSEEDKTLFKVAFEQVGYGKGKEANRITTIHSSSLLGLLVFFRVPNHPISIRGLEGIIFDKVYFEVESDVFGSNSSVDVLLVSIDENTLLFLELKFTEILSCSSHYWLEPKYKGIYYSLSDILSKADILVGEIESRVHRPRDKKKSSYTTEEFKISSHSNYSHYFGGIKQMISHTIGLMKSPLSGNQELKEKYLDCKTPRIILATMLYNPSEYDSSFRDAYEDYVKLYSRVFSQSAAIKKQIKNFQGIKRDIEIIDTPLTYQNDIVSVNGENPFMPKVREIYRLGQY